MNPIIMRDERYGYFWVRDGWTVGAVLYDQHERHVGRILKIDRQIDTNVTPELLRVLMQDPSAFVAYLEKPPVTRWQMFRRYFARTVLSLGIGGSTSAAFLDHDLLCWWLPLVVIGAIQLSFEWLVTDSWPGREPVVYR